MTEKNILKMNRKVFRLKNDHHTLEQLHSQISKTVDSYNEKQRETKNNDKAIDKIADTLCTSKTDKDSIKTKIERCLPLYYKHLDSIGAPNNAYNID
jgi:predicted RNase H-like nuclease (RuvC/YqgF family)